jgi:TP901 family phage tail tape measure protein
MINVIKEGLKEYSKILEYATRAYKEILDVPGQSVSKFKKLFVDISSAFGKSTEDIGEGIFDVVSSGFRSIAEARKISTASAKLAMVAESDLKTAINAVITSYQNYKSEGETVASITRIIAGAVNLGRMTLGELGNSLKNILGISSRVKVPFKDVMMSLSMLTRVFGRGSIEEGTRYLSRFMEAIVMPKKEARKELEALGISFENINNKLPFFKNMIQLIENMNKIKITDLRKIFPTIQSRKAWLGLTKDIKQFAGTFKDFDSISKGFNQRLKVIREMASTTFARLQNVVKNALGFIGGLIWGLVGKDLYKLTNILSKITRSLYSDKAEKFFKSFYKWAKPIVNSVLSPIYYYLKMLGKFFDKSFKKDIFKSKEMKNLRKDILVFIDDMKKIGTIIKYSIGGAIKYVIKQFEKIDKDSFKKMFSFDNIIESFNKIVAFMKTVFSKEGFGEIWSFVIDSLILVLQTVHKIILASITVIRNLIMLTLKKLTWDIQMLFIDMLVGITQLIYKTILNLIPGIELIAESIKSIMTGNFDYIFKKGKGGLIEGLKKLFIGNSLSDILMKELLGASKGMNNLAETSANYDKLVGDELKNFGGSIKNVLNESQTKFSDSLNKFLDRFEKIYNKNLDTQRSVTKETIKNIYGMEEPNKPKNETTYRDRYNELLEINKKLSRRAPKTEGVNYVFGNDPKLIKRKKEVLGGMTESELMAKAEIETKSNAKNLDKYNFKKELQSVLKERESLKERINNLQENGGSGFILNALIQKLGELDKYIEHLRSHEYNSLANKNKKQDKANEATVASVDILKAIYGELKTINGRNTINSGIEAVKTTFKRNVNQIA